MESFVITGDPDSSPQPSMEQLRQGEAQKIADLVQQMLQKKRLVWDKKIQEHHGREIGILTHRILAQQIITIIQAPTSDLNLSSDKIQEAFTLAEQFRHHPNFAAVQSGQWEQFLFLKIGKIHFNGLADLIGQDFVLDIKTEQVINPQEHRFQLWAYATASQKSQAYIAYLRHNQLCHFSTDDLHTISQEADQLITAIANKEFEPTPSVKACQYCPYVDICHQAVRSFQNQDIDEI